MNKIDKINMYDPTREYKIKQKEIDESILRVLERGDFINGQEVKELETQLQLYTKAKYALTCANGTDALHISLLALDIKPGDEIITVAYTWISTAEVIKLVNACPIWVDINKDTLCIDEDKIEEKITNKTKAIICVSLYGNMCDYEKINKISKKYNIHVIEDGAQSFGSQYKDNLSCSCQYTTIATTSFFPSKPLGCYGDGGCIFTNDDKLEEKIKAIRNHGCTKSFEHNYIGLNSRLDTLQASILLTKLKYFNQSLLKRLEIANYYTKNITNPQLKKFINYNKINSYAQYGLIVESSTYRTKLKNILHENDINVSIFYPTPLYKQKCFDHDKNQNLEITEFCCSHIINIPIYEYITYEEIDKIIKILNKNIDI
jgi:UDP-2-acetamido-2-deoxy-ribo-hexuluronate aminotransferase